MAAMLPPPPSYDDLFTQEMSPANTSMMAHSSEAKAFVVPGTCGDRVHDLQQGHFVPCGEPTGVSVDTQPLPPHPPPPPPPPSQCRDSGSFSFGERGVVSGEGLMAIEDTGRSIMSLQQQILFLQSQLNSLRHEVSTRLPPQSTSRCGLRATSPIVRGTSSSLPPHGTVFLSGSDSDLASESKRAACSNPPRVFPVDAPLCREFSLPTSLTSGAVRKEERPAKDNEGQPTNVGSEAVTTDIRGAHQDASVGTPKHFLVDMVDLLTKFYSLPPAACWRCGVQLPFTFGEELTAAALGITSRSLVDQYVSLLVERLGRGFTARSETECGAAPEATLVLGEKAGEAVEEMLSRLPVHILSRVLERAPFPTEVLVYRIVSAACALHYSRHAEVIYSRHEQAAHSEMAALPSVAPPRTCAGCNEEVAELLLGCVRFLWLPARFIEDELRRCEALRPAVESGRCAVYEGLVLRLGQALRAKICLRDVNFDSGKSCPTACLSDVFLSELCRLRLSYSFLTNSDREQTQGGNSVGLLRLQALQGKCDACFQVQGR
ncbi:hypothetical protein TRVL_04854 [Trypanosoma vivax]|nr:hypothetical protein TRVL_04854 [Trypanosoma vivax]